MEVDEVTVPSPDLPAGLSFGPVTLDSASDGTVNTRDELPVTLTPRCCQFLGIRWYLEQCRTRGVFHVRRDRIFFTPTAGVSITRAAWWRRTGYRLFTFLKPRMLRPREHAALDR